MLNNLFEMLKGGAGSGHHGHSGIPGHRGGSSSFAIITNPSKETLKKSLHDWEEFSANHKNHPDSGDMMAAVQYLETSVTDKSRKVKRFYVEDEQGIQGVVLYEIRDKVIRLHNMATAPQNHFSLPGSKRGVGKRIVDELKKIALQENKPITGDSEGSAVPFYVKQGFKPQKGFEDMEPWQHVKIKWEP